MTLHSNSVDTENESGLTPLTIFGYIFALLGGLIGLILGVIALRRGGPVGRHGGPIIALSIVMCIVWIAMSA